MKIYHQSVFDKWPIGDNSIQAIITSPPYWGLRKYDIPDVEIDGWKGQYGLEPSYKDYVAHTTLWVKEAWRVLRDDGIFFLNIGDSYQTQSGVNASKNLEDASKWSNLSQAAITMHIKQQDLMHKCKMLIPHRIAIALIDDGWILRNDILWYKSNAMPESCQDRFSKKFEYIFMFVKNPKYYFDLDMVREPHKEVSIQRLKIAVSNNNKWVNGVEGQAPQGLNQPRPNYKDRIGSMQSMDFNGSDYLVGKLNPKGKNPGDVWKINTQPSSEKHYAQWPEKLVERMLLCSTKENDIILDPFAGSGTTLKVAIQNRRVGLGIDLGYSDIQDRKLKDISIKLL